MPTSMRRLWVFAAAAIAGLVAAQAYDLALPLLPLPLFSRISAARTLDHPVRSRLLATIRERPGVGLRELARATGTGWGALNYHVNRLESSAHVRSVDAAGRRRFFDMASPALLRDAVRELSPRRSAAVAAQVLQDPGTSQRRLAVGLGMSVSLAQRHLARLERAGLVSSHRVGKTRRYEPTERLAHVHAEYGRWTANRPGATDCRTSLAVPMFTDTA